MKRYLFLIIFTFNSAFSQGNKVAYNANTPLNINYSFINYLPIGTTDIKEVAKEISQFRAKEFIINNIIGSTNGKEILFETESLASDDSGGLISVAFNCDIVEKKGLLLAFIGNNRNEQGVISKAYGFKEISLSDAQNLLNRIDEVRKSNEKYLTKDNNVNNVYIEFNDIKFVIYRDNGSKIRVFWNGFEVVWEDTAFNRSKRRLEKWFK
jgi:DNA polymerase III delta prime subunit